MIAFLAAQAEGVPVMLRPILAPSVTDLITMIPLYLCAIASVAIIINRLMALRQNRILPNLFADDVLTAIRRGRKEEALSRCEQDKSLFACVLGRGLEDCLKNKLPPRTALLEGASRQLETLNRGIEALNLISRVATQLGLLGTVLGMVVSFSEIANTANPEKALVARGIATALITTVVGLLISIPTSVMESFISRKAESYLTEFDDLLSEIAHLLESRGAAEAERPVPAVQAEIETAVAALKKAAEKPSLFPGLTERKTAL
jgi:biopolymer transport protein ExbB